MSVLNSRREIGKNLASKNRKSHHIYRAMGFLGEVLDAQDDNTGFSPRCNKDLVEELVFSYRRDLFSNLDLVFFDTTSIYFEGRGGESIGQFGFSKDHRPIVYR